MKGPSKALGVFFWLAGYLVLVKLVLTRCARRLPFPVAGEGLRVAVPRAVDRARQPRRLPVGAHRLSAAVGGGPARARRLLEPAVWGIALGILAVITDAATGWSHAVAAKMGLPSIHIEFPASALVYPGGAIIVEILYRLFPIPVLLWLLTRIPALRQREGAVFWTLAVADVACSSRSATSGSGARASRRWPPSSRRTTH